MKASITALSLLPALAVGAWTVVSKIVDGTDDAAKPQPTRFAPISGSGRMSVRFDTRRGELDAPRVTGGDLPTGIGISKPPSFGRGGHARPLLRVALVLLSALTTIVATTATAQTPDETPSGMVAFFMFSGAGCPAGWTAYAPAAGKLLLAVTDPQAVGVAPPINPMSDRAAPVHTHTFSTSVTITQKEIEAETGKNNHDGARSDLTPAVPNSPPGTTNGGTGESTTLPFIQLVVCEKH